MLRQATTTFTIYFRCACAHTNFPDTFIFLLVGAWPTLDVARIHITRLTTTELEPYARATTHYRWHCHMSSITSTFPQRAAISSHNPSTHWNIKRIISLALYHYYTMATSSETLPSIERTSASCLWRSITSTTSVGPRHVMSLLRNTLPDCTSSSDMTHPTIIRTITHSAYTAYLV